MVVALQVWRSRQNGMVYDPSGLAPCLCVGQHGGLEPKIIVYEPMNSVPYEGNDMEHQGL